MARISIEQNEGVKIKQVNVYSVFGQLIKSVSGVNQSLLNLELKAEAGIYYVEVISEGQREIIKVVMQ